MADIERERTKQKMEEERLKKDKAEREEKRRAEKLIACFPKIGNGTDLEVALDNLEDVLKQANVPENEWVTNLKTIVTGKHADLVHSLKFLED